MITPALAVLNQFGRLWDGDLHAGIWEHKENVTGQMEKLNWDAVATQASANPLKALELRWSYRGVLN